MQEMKNIPIKNILTLKPYRTFSEIEQPESVFVFRMKVEKGLPVFSIHEADGSAWKQTAIESIKEYLSEQTSTQMISAVVSIVA